MPKATAYEFAMKDNKKKKEQLAKEIAEKAPKNLPDNRRKNYQSWLSKAPSSYLVYIWQSVVGGERPEGESSF
jgi:hypothetical protein